MKYRVNWTVVPAKLEAVDEASRLYLRRYYTMLHLTEEN
jgi:hypothetical protein